MTVLHLKDVLDAWMFSVTHLHAVSAGGERINLEGTLADVPDEEQQALAVEDLRKRGKWPVKGAGGSAEAMKQPTGDPAWRCCCQADMLQVDDGVP